MAELKSKVVRGFAWNVAEKAASALFQFYVGIKVANRLFPEDYASVAILAAFFAIFNTFVDSGFSQALIRKKAPSEKDLSSAFWFNVGISALLYILLVGLSYPAAGIFGMPELTGLAPVFYLIIPLGALNIIQQTVLIRAFDFRRLSTITFISMVGGGIVAIVLAVKGAGVWALVGQRVSQMALRVALLWIFGRWRPKLQFSGESIRGMSSYSSRILATDLINNLYNSVPQFMIGNIHKGTLGYYDQGRKLKDVPVTATMNAMQSVTFPALANIRDDDRKFTASVGKVVSSIAFIMFPMMAGLIVVAADFFGLFLESRWEGAIPFFRILCLTGMMMPVTVISGNIMKTRSGGGALLRSEIIKKLFATGILAATIPFGAIPITWGMVGIAFTDMIVSFTMGKRYSGYGPKRLAHDLLPTLALTLVMAAAVWGLGLLVRHWPLGPALALKILAGIAVYMGGAALLRLDAFGEFREIIGKVAGKIKA